MLETAAIISLLRTTATLLALHGANSFQVQHYHNAALQLEKINHTSTLGPTEVATMSKTYRALMEEILQTGTLQRYQELMSHTPSGIWDILSIPGLGPKKVHALWKTLGIESLTQLASACQQGHIATIPGFGIKIQATIAENLTHLEQYRQQFHYNTALPYAMALDKALQQDFLHVKRALVGSLRRNLPIVKEVVWLLAISNPVPIIEWLKHYAPIQEIPTHTGPFAWRGIFIESQLPLHVLFCNPIDFYKQCIIQTGSPDHLGLMTPTQLPLGQVINQCQDLASEEAGYEAAQLPYIPAALREGLVEATWISRGTPPLVKQVDVKGVLHVHTTYSDGQHTLLEMATCCKEMGYTYLGITDHSQSAAYAGGLKLATIEAQHRAIEELNATLAPFKIFKGIEADILPDGNLDYPAEVLCKFDFIIASIHSGLGMTQEKATERLLKAISNPFTTILGHPTGRLLLKREGYPIDYQAVITACAAHGVAIELNANPWRLDLDWQWIPTAIQQGVKISINPDAHSKAGIEHVQLGVAIAHKGGVTAADTLNALNVEAMTAYFQKRNLRTTTLNLV